MRLLVPTRICLALRWATTPAASRVVTRAPKQSTKAAAALGEVVTLTPKLSDKEAAARVVTRAPKKKSKAVVAALREKTAQPDAPPAPSKAVKRTPKLSKIKKAALREKTAQRDALAYLDAGKNEKFRALWKGKLLTGALSDNVTLHEALLKRAESGTPDPAMLRWYAESLVDERRTPIYAKPQFESMMVPVVRALGGTIEKWKEDDKRKEKLRKWRDDYSDESLKEVLESMITYFDSGFYKKYFPAGNLDVFKNALARVEGDTRTVFVDWSDIVYGGAAKRLNFDDLLPGYSTVQVARVADTKSLQFSSFELLRTAHGKAQRDKHPFMKEPSEVERTRKIDGLCTLMLAMASRGHWLSNAAVRDDAWGLQQYLNKKSSSQVTLLMDFANDSVLRYSSSGVVLPAVDHSRAPQFIDHEKKELAFTVARDLEELPPKHPYKSIEYYSLHLD